MPDSDLTPRVNKRLKIELMDKFELHYNVQHAGWASASIRTGENEYQQMEISYLHDTLKDLADMALHLMQGAAETRAVFMDEPGEFHLVAQGFGESIEVELRYYADWASWNMYPIDRYDVRMRVQVPREQVVRSIYQNLKNIMSSLGIDEYRERWVEHDFPIREYEDLSKLIS